MKRFYTLFVVLFAFSGLLNTILGHQQEDYYINRNRATYWDDTNEISKHIARGIYLYQLQAGSVLLLRKMLISK